MANLARTFTEDEIEDLIEDLGEEKILKQPVVIEELGNSRLKEILEEGDNSTGAMTLRRPVATRCG